MEILKTKQEKLLRKCTEIIIEIIRPKHESSSDETLLWKMDIFLKIP